MCSRLRALGRVISQSARPPHLARPIPRSPAGPRPELPSGNRTLRPRAGTLVTSGRIGPIVLGHQALRLRAGVRAIVTGWARPFFFLRLGDGKTVTLRAAHVAARLYYSRVDFRRPRNVYTNFDVIHPTDVPGWLEQLTAYLNEFGAVLDPSWRSEPGQGDGTRLGVVDQLQQSHTITDSVFVQIERARLRSEFQRLAGTSRAPRTVRNLRNHAEKMLWWFAAFQRPLPPSAWDVAEYLTLLATSHHTCGSIAGARGALLHLARLNDWDTGAFVTGPAMIPGEALARANRHQVKKTPGLTLEMVTRIAIAYCFERPGRSAHRQWELAIGTAIVISFKVFARWDDAANLRWDEEYCEVHVLYVRFFLDKRKNAQAAGNFVDIARPEDPNVRGAYHVAVLARSIFRRGHVLPFISAAGSIDVRRPVCSRGGSHRSDTSTSPGTRHLPAGRRSLYHMASCLLPAR